MSEVTERVPAVSIVAARSGTGKTTLTVKLVEELTGRGHRIGTVKDDSHGFQMDREGKDTWRFMQAGAVATAIVGEDQFALLHKTKEKKELTAVLAIMENVDLILVEGFKTGHLPRIEVIRREKGRTIVSEPDVLLAVATDIAEMETGVRKFHIDDITAIADFLENEYLK